MNIIISAIYKLSYFLSLNTNFVTYKNIFLFHGHHIFEKKSPKTNTQIK